VFARRLACRLFLTTTSSWVHEPPSINRLEMPFPPSSPDKLQRWSPSSSETKEARTDRLSTKHRSWNMSRIGSKNTGPERIVRSVLHSLGFRFRLHRKSLPGTPDIVLPKYKTVIFVHGCFWHRHMNCKYCYTPKSRVEFWNKKFDGNVERDSKRVRQLEELGWRVLTVWECETNDHASLANSLSRYLMES
jgi:DNA mismatch endonuclease (patch repair protein)